MSTYWFDAGHLRDRVRMGIEDGLDDVAEEVRSEAKRRAPIRKVFRERKGFRHKTRALTEDEKALAIARAVRYYANNDFAKRRAVAHIRYYARVKLPTRGSANNLVASRKLRVMGVIRQGRFTSTSGAFRNRAGGYEPGPEMREKLTTRGKYEVRTGRAIHLEASQEGHSVRVQAGGALKASIDNKGVTETASGVQVTVSADIRYAKFVEFPTIRTKAQPFLLPALHDQRGKATRTIASAIRKNLGG